MSGVLLILFGYLLGSIPTGLLVGLARGVDVRKVGSGNIGTANVLRSAGRLAAFLTLLGDMLKGLVPVLVARGLSDSEWVWALTALAAIVGHCWPVFLRFRGGKGVATGAGSGLALVPPVGLGVFVLWWIIAFAFRYTSLAAIVVSVAAPVGYLITGQPLPYLVYAFVGAAVVLWRHRENARALLEGRERRFGQRRRDG
ncbi:MAG: glycerol-3-phosphate 1-O-acyltransferase PlsY [Rubrobacteraceae bacterium]|uniref:glycerol-3-phosphate 1-O-acyltransferase PlsY n=1 Tax=Rubrobacter naiadicus TaxID=1392641 RepID=UPI002362AFDA|nr:glycerol-3-phosphate 1-O-acyltransferase PlsY [Rubrobacter naiadicus]MBX6763944.1 glycerol-3-phosphate 1-O-acyltransferase PlsY [Rubrobacteraceae bacterium]MCL6437360.1 glycerol-3-phosphate 1-O-acyltransferase PlsY [Rubrobacteraceae bacterium]